MKATTETLPRLDEALAPELVNEMRDVETDVLAEYAHTPAGKLNTLLSDKYDLDTNYNAEDQQRYTTHTDEIIEALSQKDDIFARIDDAQRAVFGKGVAAALYHNTEVEAKTAALREVIALYRETARTEAPVEPQAEPSAEKPGMNLRESLSLTKDLMKHTHAHYEGEHAGRFARIRNAIGKAATMSTMALAGVGAYAERVQYRAETLKQREDYNRLRFAAGTLGALGAASVAAMVANRYNIAFDNMHHGSGTSTAMDVLGVPKVNYEYNFAAKSQIIVPTHGRGNTIGSNLMPLSKMLGEDGTVVKGIDYPAGIKTPVTPEDTHTLDQSVRIASDKQYSIYAQNPNKTITYVGYSEGGVTQTVTEARIRQANGGTLPDNVRFVYVGAPGIEGGSAENEWWGVVPDSIKQSLGLESFDNKSGGGKNVSYYKNESDFWAAGKSASPLAMADMGIGTAFGGTHGAYGGNIPSTTERNPDGSVTTTYRGGNNVVNGYRLRSGIANALYQNQGVPVTREMDEAILAMRGDENGNYNAAEITTTLAKAAERQQPGTGDIVRMTLGSVLTQDLVDSATQVQNNLPRAISQITNPGALPAPSLDTGTTELPGSTMTATPTAQPSQLPAPQNTAPVVTQLPQPVQQPAQQFVEQAEPLVQQTVKQLEQAVPKEFAPQVQQGKAFLNQFGIRIP